MASAAGSLEGWEAEDWVAAPGYRYLAPNGLGANRKKEKIYGIIWDYMGFIWVFGWFYGKIYGMFYGCFWASMNGKNIWDYIWVLEWCI